jgi:hypothetical protein
MPTMAGDPIKIDLLAPGVYLITGAEPAIDGVLVDRTKAATAWLAVADVTVDPRSGDDVEQLIQIAALRYHRTVAAELSSARLRSAGSP